LIQNLGFPKSSFFFVLLFKQFTTKPNLRLDWVFRLKVFDSSASSSAIPFFFYPSSLSKKKKKKKQKKKRRRRKLTRAC